MTRIYINMDFYDSPAAAEMAQEYRQQAASSFIKVEELLRDADETEKQIAVTHKILFRRKRVRLEIKLQRILLAVLGELSLDQQELGNQIYQRLQNCVDRLEKLC